MSDNGHLRVSALQRDNAIAALRDAAADGRLTFAELEERVPKALAATLREELIAVLRDLVPAEEMAAVIADASVVGDGPGYRFDTPLLWEAGHDTLERIGPLIIPPFLEVITGWSRVYLNFAEATTATGLIDLVVLSGGGTVVLVVPDGWGVDTERLGTSGQAASARSKVGTRPQPGKPRIVVRGRTTAALIVRHPNWYDQRKLRKAAQRREREVGSSPRAPVGGLGTLSTEGT